MALVSMTALAALAVQTPRRRCTPWRTSPATRSSASLTTYTITSGSIKVVIHEGEAASGNANFTGTLTPQNVVAEDSAATSTACGARSGSAERSTRSRVLGVLDGTRGSFQVASQGSRTVDSVKRDVPTTSCCQRQRQREGLRFRDLRGAREEE